MIEVLGSPPQVAAFRISGVFEADDYQEVIDTLEYKLVRHQRVSVYMDMLELDYMTVQAAAKRVGYSVAKLGEWHRFPRIAVISERRWISAITRIFSALIPRVEIRTFDRDEKDQAMDWALRAAESGYKVRSNSNPHSTLESTFMSVMNK